MKTINFVSRNFYPDSRGGCEKVFYEVYKRAINDYKVRTISGYFNEKKFPKFNSIFPHIKTKNKIIRYIYYAINMSLRAKNRKADLIHANNLECIRLSNTPFIFTIHHVGHFIDPKIRKKTFFNRLMRKILVLQANRADKIITVSKSTKNDLISIGVKKDKIIIISNGVDLTKFKPRKTKKNKKFIITHVSRISPEKAQHFTINTIKNLPENIKKNIELRIIGYVSDKDYYNVLEKNNWIKYFINVSDKKLPKLIAKSDLVVFPTMMSEGFGLVVLEAMACGVPVIASDQTSIREAGSNICQYFKQGNKNEFAKKILKLYKNKKLRNSLSKKGLEWVKKFSWDKVYEKHKKLYRELLK